MLSIGLRVLRVSVSPPVSVDTVRFLTKRNTVTSIDGGHRVTGERNMKIRRPRSDKNVSVTY